MGAQQGALAAPTCKPSAAGRYAELVVRLDTLSLITKAVLPPIRVPVGESGDPASVTVTLDHLPGLGTGLADWLQCVTVLLVHRSRLPARDFEAFVAPFADVVPDLGELPVAPL